jgi:hypothetical protein
LGRIEVTGQLTAHLIVSDLSVATILGTMNNLFLVKVLPTFTRSFLGGSRLNSELNIDEKGQKNIGRGAS